MVRTIGNMRSRAVATKIARFGNYRFFSTRAALFQNAQVPVYNRREGQGTFRKTAYILERFRKSTGTMVIVCVVRVGVLGGQVRTGSVRFGRILNLLRIGQVHAASSLV